MQKRVRLPKKKNISISIPPSQLKLDNLGTDLNQTKLTKPQSTRNQSQDRPKPKVSANVNSYRHLMNEKFTSDPDIEWVLKLRTPSQTTKNLKLEQTALQPFSFDDKGIEGQKLGRQCSELNTRNHLYKVNHLLFHRRGASISQGLAQFETGLRSYSTSSDKLQVLEKSWKNTPKKDRQEFPEMYPSYEDTVNIKSWSTKNLEIKTHTGFEGHLNFPKYAELYNRQTKNVGEIRHILKAPGQSISSTDWQISMRQYEDPKKVKEDNGQTEKNAGGLGELKKSNKKPNRL